MNEGLFSALSGLAEWKELLNQMHPASCTAVYGMAEGERPFLAAALFYKTRRPVLLVSPTELTAQKQAQDINRLLGGGAGALSARELQFSRAASSRESTWQRLHVLEDVLNGQIKILCVSAESLCDRLPPATLMRAACLRVAEGERHPPEALMEKLLCHGYERVPMVEGPGQCAMRGSILDLFPPSDSDALRIEFFDDEIDSIRRFDCISQRSIARVKDALLSPATECLLSNPQAASERLRAAIEAAATPAAATPVRKMPKTDALDALPSLDDFLSALDVLEGENLPQAEHDGDAPLAHERDQSYRRHLDDCARVAAGYPPRTAPMWMNVLCEQTVGIEDYLPNGIVLCDQPEQWQNRISVRQSAFIQEFEDAWRRGDSFEAQKGLLYPYDELISLLQPQTCVTLSDMKKGMGQFSPTAFVELASKPVMPYQSRLEPLCHDIADWREQGFCIVLLTGGEARGQRLKRALAEQGVQAIYCEELNGNLISREVLLLPITYAKGFVHAGAKLAVVSDSDLYGTAYQRARKKTSAGERIASFTDLKTGDYVVHDLHGVGLYQGIVKMSSDGITRDYLLIQYAGNDKLYVPTDQFDRVQKFIGAEHSAPKLNKLGGAEWQRQKSKVKAGLQKLAFDLAELYAKRLQQNGYQFSHENPWQNEFEDAFPYELTPDQQQSVADIEADMESRRNMDRLLCGDVGYGKTEVALRAAFKAVVEGKQVALLAPTTILVQQHYNTIKKRFGGFPCSCEMLSRFRSPKEQKEILSKLKAGTIDFIVGTHRLLAKDVQFRDLGLLIVDEEQRFGVNHKESIKHLKSRVDVLTLSATPIPRTLHMSMTGIRDMSVLETPPEERLPVKTHVLEYDDSLIRDAIRRELARGGQVYFLYNRVRSIEQMYGRLQALVPEARIGIAHGQMRENALEDVMLDFYAGAYDVLLCTTIIESGLDVPQANTLIVFDAERFGLSQLYQIRGRVGRSNRQAYAYFTVRQNKVLSETAEKRLSAIREFTEFGAGYRIAMRDLEIRGAGDVLGPEQHGHLSTVGYDMYLKLMEQAVGEVQGREETPELDTRVELRIDAYLPDDYIDRELLRVEIYKRIAMIEDEATRLDIEEELIDRFGDIPLPVENLMRIAQLRAITRRLGISHLQLKADGLHLRMEEQFLPDPMRLLTALQNTDARLVFIPKQPPELLIRQSGLTPEDALRLAIDLLGRVHSDVRRQTEEQKAMEKAREETSPRPEE